MGAPTIIRYKVSDLSYQQRSPLKTIRDEQGRGDDTKGDGAPREIIA